MNRMMQGSKLTVRLTHIHSLSFWIFWSSLWMVTTCHDQALLREDPGYSAEANRRNPAVSLLGGVGRDQLGGLLSFLRIWGVRLGWSS